MTNPTSEITTDGYADDQVEVDIDLGERGGETGVWVKDRHTGQELFISSHGLHAVVAVLERVARLEGDLEQLGLRLAPGLRPGELGDRGGDLADSQGQPLDGSFVVVIRRERPSALGVLYGGVGLRGGVVEAHDSSPSVGASASSSTAGCGDSHPTEGDHSPGAPKAGAA